MPWSSHPASCASTISSTVFFLEAAGTTSRAAMLGAFLLPPLALALGRGFADVFYLEFLFISIWPGIIALITVQWLKRGRRRLRAESSHQGLLLVYAV